MPDLKKMLTLEALSEALPSWLKRSTKPEYNADEIDSTLTTNQFVTASDKENWNAKGTYSKPSGGIPKSDLSSIVQTSLDNADSALQSETDPTVPSWAKQPNKPSYTQDEVPDGSTYKRVTQTEKNAWSEKQNALTTTQMQAVNSGITSAGVAQISTNQTNVLYALETGVKNALVVEDREENGSGTIKFSVKNGVVTVTGTGGSSTSFFSINFTGISGRFKLNGCPSGGSDTTYLQRIYTADGSISKGIDRGSGTAEFTLESNVEYQWTIRIQANYAIQNSLVFKPMLYQADTDGSAFQTGALPNYELTRLESEDRASLAEVVDSGAKNKAEIYSTSANSINISVSGYTATFSGTSSATGSIEWCNIHVDKTGSYILYYKMSTAAGRFTVKNKTDGTNLGDYYNTKNETPIVLNLTAGKNYVISSWFASGSASACAIDIMICTSVEFKVSPKLVPYRLSYNTLGKLKWKSYNIGLSTVSFIKSSGGVYYYSYDVSSDFSTLISVTINGFEYIPNLGYSAIMNATNRTIGIMVHDPSAPQSLTFNDGNIRLMVLGFE